MSVKMQKKTMKVAIMTDLMKMDLSNRLTMGMALGLGDEIVHCQYVGAGLVGNGECCNYVPYILKCGMVVRRSVSTLVGMFQFRGRVGFLIL